VSRIQCFSLKNGDGRGNGAHANLLSRSLATGVLPIVLISPIKSLSTMTENMKNVMMIIASLAICSSGGVGALSMSSRARRNALQNISAIGGGVFASSSLFLPQKCEAATPLPLQTSSGAQVRIEELGGGFDILSPKPLSASEVYYPSSMIDTKWRVQRVVTSVEGNLEQSALTWKLLGGSDERAFTSKLTEVYEADFIAAPENMKDATYTFEGKPMRPAILDRSLELSSRVGIDKGLIQLDTQSNTLEYTRNNNEGQVNLTIVARKIEPPTEEGFGSDEIYRILSSAGGIFANVYRCARVRRRFRRGFDESTGKRILDGIEIVTTHRVLDGVAGIELPTSTCKTRLRYTQL